MAMVTDSNEQLQRLWKEFGKLSDTMKFTVNVKKQDDGDGKGKGGISGEVIAMRLWVASVAWVVSSMRAEAWKWVWQGLLYTRTDFLRKEITKLRPKTCFNTNKSWVVKIPSVI